jgi:hypothetical protein
MPGESELRTHIADELAALRALLATVERDVRELRRAVDELRQRVGAGRPAAAPRPRSHRIW